MGQQAGIYTRISRDREGTRAGVKRQREDCLALAEARGWSVVEIYEDDDRSAYSGAPRPAYGALCGALKDGVIDTVVAWHPDRLHRSPAELEAFIDLIEGAGAHVETVTTGAIDLGSVEGRLMARVVGSVARAESEHKSRRLQRKHAEIAKEGRPHGGGRPFGYEYGDRGGLVIVPEEAKAIRAAAKAVLRGASCRSIAREWNAAELLTPRGGQWLPQVVRRVLLGPAIRGKRAYRGTVMEAQWPSIIDAKTGDALRARLTDPSRVKNGGSARQWPLAGLCYCGRCGSRMVSGRSNGKPAMVCKVASTPTSCGGVVIVMSPLVTLLRDLAVERLLLAPRALAASEVQSADEDASSELDTLQARSRDIEQMFIDGKIAPDRFQRMTAEVERRQEAILAKLRSVQHAHVLAGMPRTRAALHEAWDRKGVEWQHRLLSLVFERITIEPATYRGERFNAKRIEPKLRRLGGHR